MLRIGQAIDIHPLKEGRDLILGGVKIDHEKGLDGHSDADVLAHAVMDALLGAAALGDIGTLFPDSDPAYEGADSLALLGRVARILEENGYKVGNVDATVLAQRPKLAPHIMEMRARLADAMGTDPGRVSIKATTEEGLGFTGAVLAERDKGGPFRSFQEFCARMYDADLNKRVLDSLIRSGCFDSMGCRRSQLMKVHEQVVDAIARDRKRNLEGQFDLFGGGGDALSVPTVILPDIPEFSPAERMAMEKETTGLYLSGHPMDAYRETAREQGAAREKKADKWQKKCRLLFAFLMLIW